MAQEKEEIVALQQESADKQAAVEEKLRELGYDTNGDPLSVEA